MNHSTSRNRASIAVDCLIVFISAWLLVKPIFKAKYLDRWASIESTFIADGRFLKEHWPHPRWQPLWYMGTRFDYIYPPALRYGTAVLARIWLPVKAYHFYTGFFFCVGIAGVYLFVRVVNGSRGAAWLAAAATALLSPSFLFLERMRLDAGLWAPLRLWVLMRYGEGPHMTALALLPIALACASVGLHRKQPAALALASVFSALVVSNNFYGATALAIFFPLLVWSVWLTRQDHGVWVRSVAIILLAYGLTAFWLTPSYLHITVFNLRFVAQEGKPWCVAVTLLVTAAFLWVSYRLARGEPAAAYPVFVLGSLLLLSLLVLGYEWADFRVVGSATRLIPELDLAMILAAVEGLRRLWSHGLVARVGAALMVTASFATAIPFISHAVEPWFLYQPDSDFQTRVQYRLQDWIWRNLPDTRILPVGSVRFWYDAWHDLPQLSGGSEQGILNPMVKAAHWEIALGPDADLAIDWMVCLGVDAIIVPEKNSQEIYHDILYPRKFAGVLPVLYDDHAGNVIYRTPRRFPGIARLVNRGQFDVLRPVLSQTDRDGLQAYAHVVEAITDTPARTEWKGTDALDVHARVSPGQAVLVQESYDPYWRAYAAGRRLPIRKDLLGLMLIEAPPGEQDIHLVFELPLENQIGQILSFCSAGIVLFLIGMRYRVGGLTGYSKQQ